MKNQEVYMGLSSIYESPRIAVISHRGNMGNNIDSVRVNIDTLLYAGAFDLLREKGSESGSPDYMYMLKVPIKDYNLIKEGSI